MAEGNDGFLCRTVSLRKEKRLHGSVREWLAAAKRDRGIYSKKYGGVHYLLISSGMKPNQGYRLVLERVEREPRPKVLVREVSPPEGGMYPQVLTYPYLVLQVKGQLPQVLDASTGELFIQEEEGP
ncbi:protease complex subunit PrcB family protein [Salinithrix halophila]|uniref:Protease complex subunit PrcB family protein n=1 Tax=Salinithrix halophila TaxID=1485204 RepID=A0ABV8JI44_9BACL